MLPAMKRLLLACPAVLLSAVLLQGCASASKIETTSHGAPPPAGAALRIDDGGSGAAALAGQALGAGGESAAPAYLGRVAVTVRPVAVGALAPSATEGGEPMVLTDEFQQRPWNRRWKEVRALTVQVVRPDTGEEVYRVHAVERGRPAAAGGAVERLAAAAKARIEADRAGPAAAPAP